MVGWMDRKNMDGWMDKKNEKKLMDGGWIEKNEKIDGWLDGWDGQTTYMKKMDGWMDKKQMDSWTDGKKRKKDGWLDG